MVLFVRTEIEALNNGALACKSEVSLVDLIVGLTIARIRVAIDVVFVGDLFARLSI